jgi:hypothetical protein
MFVRQRFVVAFACAWALLGAISVAAEVSDEESTETVDAAPAPVIDGACDVNGTKSEGIKYDPARAIPDGDANGIVLGPLSFPNDGKMIQRVVLEVIVGHTRVGDLTIKLGYDLTCNGSIDYSSTVVCRPRGTATTTPAPCGTGTGAGCAGDLSCGKFYRFGDDGASALAVGTCPGTLSSGCYKPPVDGGTPLTVFRDLPKTGCWYLTVIDPVTPNKGSVCEWTIYLENHLAVGVEASSWGNTKTLYR